MTKMLRWVTPFFVCLLCLISPGAVSAISSSSEVDIVACGGTILDDSSTQADSVTQSWKSAMATGDRRSALPDTKPRKLYQISFSAISTGDTCSVFWNPKVRTATHIRSIKLDLVEAIPTADLCKAQIFVPTLSDDLQVSGPNYNFTLTAVRSFQAADQRTNGGNPFLVGVSTGSVLEPVPPFPIKIQIPSGCTVVLALDSTREGTMEWYVWIPLAAWAVVAAITLFFMLSRRDDKKSPLFFSSTKGTVLSYSIFFYGFVGCVIGLGAELGHWQNPQAAFPLPGTITFFLCMSLIYLAMIIGAGVFTFPIRSLVLSLVLKMLIQGVILGTMFLLWIQKLWILATVSLILIVAGNLMGLQMFVKLCRMLPDEGEDIVDESISIGALWCPPAAPFTPLAFLYVQLSMIVKKASRQAAKKHAAIVSGGKEEDVDLQEERANGSSPDGAVPAPHDVIAPGKKKRHFARHIDYVRVSACFDALMGIRLTFVSYLPQLVLLILATMFHPPMAVLLYFFILLLGWEVTLSFKCFFTERRRATLGNDLGIPLWTAIKHYIETPITRENTHLVEDGGYNSLEMAYRERYPSTSPTQRQHSVGANTAVLPMTPPPLGPTGHLRQGSIGPSAMIGIDPIQARAMKGLPTEPLPVEFSPDGRPLGTGSIPPSPAALGGPRTPSVSSHQASIHGGVAFPPTYQHPSRTGTPSAVGGRSASVQSHSSMRQQVQQPVQHSADFE